MTKAPKDQPSADWPAAERESYLDLHYRHYFLTMPLDEQVRHAALIREATDRTAPARVVQDAAALAVRELYPDASPRVQQATLRTLRESLVLSPNLIPQPSPITAPLRIRLLACMLLITVGLLGLWQRERAMLRRTALA